MLLPPPAATHPPTFHLSSAPAPSVPLLPTRPRAIPLNLFVHLQTVLSPWRWHERKERASTVKDLPCFKLILRAWVAVLALALASPAAQAQSTTATLWPTSTVPSVPDSGPDSAVELGLAFSSSQAGTVTGLQFYKSAANTGTHVGNLWSSSGKHLASVTFTNETASGWQQANFATPVAITAGALYIISYHTTVGHYADTQEFFSSALSVPPLSAPVNAGVYKYGSRSGYPNSVWNASNYWVQPLVSIGAAPAPKP